MGERVSEEEDEVNPEPQIQPSFENDPPLRVMSLHALAYCERLFYLEEVEELYVADDRVYAGRELHESVRRAEEEFEHVETLELGSAALGLTGKLDAAKRRDGSVLPYEHKRGKAKRGPDGEAVAWDTDALQVAAYAMLLEEHAGRPVAEARVRYHADNVTVRVPVDEPLRGRVRAAVGRARALSATTDRPPVTDNENLCRRCSLAPVCLPEEARLAAGEAVGLSGVGLSGEGSEVRRLFPADDGRMSLHVVSPGARVGRGGACMTVTPREGEGKPTKHASREVGAVLLHGQAQITTQALRLCADEQIAVHWLGVTGTHFGSLTTTAGQVQRRIRQYAALADGAFRLSLAKRLVAARVEGQHRYLLRATRGDEAARKSIQVQLNAITTRLPEAERAADADALRGHEGAAAREYWSCFNALLADAVPESLRYVGRSRRPPADRLSAALNFGYGLLQTAVMRAILAAGLEPSLGFYHTPRSAAHPLVLDLMEPFRVLLWDVPLVGSLNRGSWDPRADFRVTTRGRRGGGEVAGVWLSDEGRRKAIGLFEARLAEQWKHPVVGYSLSYRRTLELEARLLEKEWSGEPGLFARMRLR